MFKYLNRRISTPTAITIIVILAVIFFGGVFAYQYFFVKSQPIIQTQNQTDQTAGWKTYKSNVYKYEIKYPPTYITSTQSMPTDVPGIDEADYSGEDYSVNFKIFARSADFILRDCLKDLAGNDITKTKDVGGNTFYAFYDKKQGTGGRMELALGAIESEYHIIKDNQCYIIQYTVFPKDSSLQTFKILDQILSTFKFTTSTEQTAGWKTYTNSDYGFEIKYPGSFNLIDRSENGFLNIRMDSGSKVRYIQVGLTDSLPIRTRLAVEPEPGLQVSNSTEKFGDMTWLKRESISIPQNGIGTYGDIISYRVGKNNLTYMISCGNCIPPPNGGSEADVGFVDFISTFKFTNPATYQYGNQLPIPRINSITPASGPKGTIVEINGTGLSGFEGDLDVYFEKTDGTKIMLTDTFGDYAKTQDKLIKVKVIEPCQAGEKVIGRYSGIESDCNYIELTPGVYKVYTEPLGVKSNIVNFQITK